MFVSLSIMLKPFQKLSFVISSGGILLSWASGVTTNLASAHDCGNQANKFLYHFNAPPRPLQSAVTLLSTPTSPCLNQCSGHGTCVSDATDDVAYAFCRCQSSQYAGPDCSIQMGYQVSLFFLVQSLPFSLENLQ